MKKLNPPRTAAILYTLLLSLHAAPAQTAVINSIEYPGRITWTSPALNVTGRVEWAASPDGPWSSSWTNQRNIFITATSNAAPVAMFYRVAYEKPDPHFPDITPVQALDLIGSRTDSGFVIIDVRTPGEYNAQHIIGALNIDYLASSTFTPQIDSLDKNKTYLIYCQSGNRSGQAHDVMLGLGFKEVYNMLGGMSALVSTPGAGNFLTP